MKPKKKKYDVIICGGGLAGLTLARQLKVTFPELATLVIEKQSFPKPIATFKVGESTTEIASFYLKEDLQLDSYFKNAHYKKLGFRFILGDSNQKWTDRPEIGLSDFPPYDSLQMDRGVLENDLYSINKLSGVEIIDATAIKDILIHEDAQDNIVQIKTEDQELDLHCRWVIDAMGRRLFFHEKFKLTKKMEIAHNAVWFRVKGRFDMDDIVSNENRTYHNHVPNKNRFYSTFHIMGPGYWVWLIPLSSGHTSIGIVASEAYHEQSTFSTKAKATTWLETYEPDVAKHLENFKMEDFLRNRNYSHSATEVASINRWACTGEAAVFADPLYSVGSNMIAYENTCIVDLIRKDLNNSLEENHVQRLSQFVISQNEWLIDHIQGSYPYLGHPQVYTLAYLWSVVIGWSLDCPQMFNKTFLDLTVKTQLDKENANIIFALGRMKQLFKDWYNVANNTFTFDYIDYLKIPFILEIFKKNLEPNKSLETLIADRIHTVELLEEFAQVIFLIVVKDVMPEKLHLFQEPVWLNVNAISLDADSWEKDGLFEPKTTPRNLKNIENQILEVIQYKSQTKEKIDLDISIF
ncbi:tryptophan 7-halogenase [Kordia sp. YSTF-M3]|uniref:Tryptophan 7-halogenase n=1 Tax=Kordia aestuariivivens TaxID=2759037 RepID=A0ABR7QGF5_9FLAO|nr:FAD-dependent monooxygenase [Kordia aestuariivivens]MBC8757652.1 tryptophan 7-halogenase [Kordia aestuariivivens]